MIITHFVTLSSYTRETTAFGGISLALWGSGAFGATFGRLWRHLWVPLAPPLGRLWRPFGKPLPSAAVKEEEKIKNLEHQIKYIRAPLAPLSAGACGAP